jgi:hypothetical protein
LKIGAQELRHVEVALALHHIEAHGVRRLRDLRTVLIGVTVAEKHTGSRDDLKFNSQRDCICDALVTDSNKLHRILRAEGETHIAFRPLWHLSRETSLEFNVAWIFFSDSEDDEMRPFLRIESRFEVIEVTDGILPKHDDVRLRHN